MLSQSTVHHFSPEALARLSSPSITQGVPISVPEDAISTHSSPLTVNRAYRLINVLACTYACARIAHCYHQYFVSKTPSATWYDRIVQAGDSVMFKKMRFALAATIILGETLVGKSLAKLAVLCATGDITDVIEQGLVRMKNVVVG